MQRIPPCPPGITDPLVVVQDHERQTLLSEVIADSETSLASTDDDGPDCDHSWPGRQLSIR